MINTKTIDVDLQGRGDIAHGDQLSKQLSTKLLNEVWVKLWYKLNVRLHVLILLGASRRTNQILK